MMLPVFGVAYCISGILSILTGLLDRHAKPMVDLGVMMLLLSALNAYIEEWKSSYAHTFVGVGILLFIGFFLAHAEWSIALMRQVVSARRGQLSSIAFLPIVWMLSGSVLLLLPRFLDGENPPLEAYTFIVFICLVHVPCFAVGKDKTLKTADKQFLRSPSNSPLALLRPASVALLTPTLVTLFVQLARRDDWRLFSLNAILMAANLALVIIARPPKPASVAAP